MMSKGRPGVLKSTSGVDSGASFASEWEMLLYLLLLLGEGGMTLTLHIRGLGRALVGRVVL